MNCYLTPTSLATVTAAIAEKRAQLAELRAQRPFRQIARAENVVSIAAARRNRNPLLQIGGAL